MFTPCTYIYVYKDICMYKDTHTHIYISCIHEFTHFPGSQGRNSTMLIVCTCIYMYKHTCTCIYALFRLSRRSQGQKSNVFQVSRRYLGMCIHTYIRTYIYVHILIFQALNAVARAKEQRVSSVQTLPWHVEK